MDSKKLSNLQKEFLREVGNIAAGNATTAMAKLIDERIKMEVPSVKIVTINELMEIIGGPEKLVVTIFFRIEGELPGTVYFVLRSEEHTSELQSRGHLVCRLLLEKKNKKNNDNQYQTRIMMA